MGKKRQVKKQEKEEENYMVKNGSILMEELMSSGNGKCNPIRCFSAKQLRTATNNFQSHCKDFFGGNFFRAVLDNRSVLIKISTGSLPTAEMACRDIAISSRMSSHSRVLKLLGCCLELPVPALVYEDAEVVQLNGIGGIGYDPSNKVSPTPSSFSWKIRVRIGKDIAHALTYLHTAFSRSIIHCHVKATSVFLDKDLVPKLSDFSYSISIPEGETRVQSDRVMGTLGYIAPEYFKTLFVTEKSDVYGIGVLLLVLLTGKSFFVKQEADAVDIRIWVQQKSWDQTVDLKILEEVRQMDEEQQLQFHSQLQAFLNLALSCAREEEENRPLMIDVAKELDRIHRTSSSAAAPP
ncbi:hypothetical protein FNV43_RR19340 [Rhamnella rubrinervis]|uniref:Protein kinase domain-containing protein n=1 Tax=Rhamnella rubrinervis TaxID=2594499 RepID=A0A8K0GWE5_9ROSA|nr:hypothetical protein FNV43_RR19340 [Rhamnella rubrinervis]